VADHLGDRIDLEVERPPAIDHHVMLEHVGRHRNAVAAAREEIDGRRAIEGELLGVDHALEIRGAAIEQEHDVEGVAGGFAQRVDQAVDGNELVTLRKRKILMQEAITGKAARRVRKQRLLLAEAFGPHHPRGQEAMPLDGPVGAAHDNAADASDQQLV
jgi:hypothetical protein